MSIISIKSQIYEEGGNTRQWLTIKIDTDTEIRVLVKFELLKTNEEKAKIAYSKVGDQISIRIDENNIVLEVL